MSAEAKSRRAGGGAVTAADVAKTLGVSRSTVSRAFTPDAYVKPKTRERILAAAERLGYQPNAIAQALISQRSRLVGVIMGDLGNPFHATMQSALTREVNAAGMIPLIAQLGPGVAMDDAVALFRQYQAGAVLLTSMAVERDAIALCRAQGLQVALLNRVDVDGTAPSVCADLEAGGAAAARRLVAEGRRRIAVVTGVPGVWTAGARRAGHIQGLAEAGLAPLLEVGGDYTVAAGAAAAERLFGPDAPAPRPDAVLCANDLTAIGLLDAARTRYGLRCPDDAAIVGFDDIPMASWESYRLTTVRLPVGEMVSEMVALLKRMVFDGEGVDERRLAPCALIERATTDGAATPTAAATAGATQECGRI